MSEVLSPRFIESPGWMDPVAPEASRIRLKSYLNSESISINITWATIHINNSKMTVMRIH